MEAARPKGRTRKKGSKNGHGATGQKKEATRKTRVEPAVTREGEQEEEGTEGACGHAPEGERRLQGAVGDQPKVTEETPPPMAPLVVSELPRRMEPSQLVADFMPDGLSGATGITAAATDDLIQFDEQEQADGRDKPVLELARSDEDERAKVTSEKYVHSEPVEQVSSLSEKQVSPEPTSEDEFLEAQEELSPEEVGMTTKNITMATNVPVLEGPEDDSRTKQQTFPQTNQQAQQSELDEALDIVTNQIEALSTATSQVAQVGTEEGAGLEEGEAEGVAGTEVMATPSAPTLVDRMERSGVDPSAPTLLDPMEASRLVCREPLEAAVMPLYPVLDSLASEQELPEELSPFSEEDLSVLYPNPQLDSNARFIDSFIQASNQERHPLFDLLIMYLKARQTLTTALAHVESLRKDYNTHQPLLWNIETQNISSTGKCRDNVKVSHGHSHKFAVFNPEAAIQVNAALKSLREALQEELCMKSYSSQLARIHVNHYLFQLLRSTPELAELDQQHPVTSWIPAVPPGVLPRESHASDLRDCISVLFMFERRHVRDKGFSEDCRTWLDMLLNALLRVATLTDHQFIFNHLLRCPPGIGKWGRRYLQLISPLVTNSLVESQFQNTSRSSSRYHTLSDQSVYDWGVGEGIHRDWGGPLLDHFVTMLATLMLPIKEREDFLALLQIPETEPITRVSSQPWTIIEDDFEDEGDGGDTALLLKESDFISFFDQFPFSDLFHHVLQIPTEGEFNVSSQTSCNMLRLLAFCTCLVRLLGAAFSTLRLARYKEFIKQVGRTIRQTVQYVADHWVTYKSYRLQSCGETMASLPRDEGGRGDPRYSLNRLQLEFDQFVLRATQWILTAHKLGAWQFLADMPYGSVSLPAIWRIFWSVYSSKQLSASSYFGCAAGGSGGQQGAGLEMERSGPGDGAWSAEEIQQSMKDQSYKAQFVDTLMKTYTSEAVFLLTTFVNMARSRTADSDQEKDFINTVTLEIFECTQVTEFARDAYSRTGHSLLDSIAIVHPFVMSTIMQRVERAVETVGENCILLFKNLPLHLWLPTSPDLRLIQHWLVSFPLSSHQSMLSRVILSGLNWGTNSEYGSMELVLDWSVHRSVALSLVEAHSRHLPSQPGGKDYVPSPSGLSKYANSFHRLTMSTDQSNFTTWSWEILLMLKLHPNQILTQATPTLRPTSVERETPVQTGQTGLSGTLRSGGTPVNISHPSSGSAESDHGGACGSAQTGIRGSQTSPKSGQTGFGAKDPKVYQHGPGANEAGLAWVRLNGDDRELVLPDLTSSSERELAELRDAVKYEGKLAYYVALCLTSIGSDTDHFMASGILMLNSLLENGYYLPALRLIANVTPQFFKHKKILMEETGFLHVIIMMANADTANASLKERITFSTPTPIILRKMAALLQTQLQSACAPGGVGGDTVLHFWICVLLAYPNWHKERSTLYLLDVLSMAAFPEPSWRKALEKTLLEAYSALQPTQTRRSSFMSFIPIVGGDDGPPSLSRAIPPNECLWLTYNALIAEETFEEEEGIWKSLLLQLKRDPKITVETALKRALADLKLPASSLPTTHLSIYKWAELCSSIDHTHPLCPLVWQRFFMLYLQRPLLDSSMPERESFGLRFFSSRNMVLRKKMKASLSNACKELKVAIEKLEEDAGEGWGGNEQTANLKRLLPNCLSLYQTLRLWLEEPRLHDASLYLPGLPPQYEPNRLANIFQHRKAALWLECVPLWKVRGQLNALTEEWVQVAAYQKALPSKSLPHDASPDTNLTKISKRLKKHSKPLPPSPYQACPAPFTLLSEELLLSRETLMAVIMDDVRVIADQANLFCTRTSTLAKLDSEYMSGVPELYTNEPRQFHVKVPCQSRFNRSHHCQGPATIVFRFHEMTVHPKWDQRLKMNRNEYSELLTTLTKQTSPQLCKAVMRIEHTISELSRLSDAIEDAQENIALQCGITLFYSILEFITMDTRQYPPSCQFLTSCVQILGQEFVQRDSSQAMKVLELLLAQQARADLLVPLFQPNACPQDFLHMYGTTAEVAVKEGPAIAFSLLTKFGVSSWLEDSSPSMSDRSHLLRYVSQGLTLCGAKPPAECEVLIEVYRRHFQQLVDYQFPDHYNEALMLLISATDNNTIVPVTWADLAKVTVSVTGDGQTFRLGLQQVQESCHIVAQHYLQRRLTSEQPLYSIISWEYVHFLGQFLRQVCLGIVEKWVESVAVEAVKPQEAIMECWHTLIGVFSPWIAPIASSSTQPTTLIPCNEIESGLMSTMVGVLVECSTATHHKLKDPTNSITLMGLVWDYYFTTLCLQNTPDPIMQAYHSSLSKLPWSDYLPNLGAMDTMMKLKLLDRYPQSSFVFLGRIFPQIDWKTIVDAYCNVSNHGDSAAPVQLHIMLLQLLVMLAAEKEVMQKEDSGIPKVMADAHEFHWEYVEAKTYQDIMQWQKTHCDPAMILHTGSSLSLSLRLLKAAAGFPRNSSAEQVEHQDSWEKRINYIQVVVELIGKATHKKETHVHSYSDALSHLFQTAVDICVYEPKELGGSNIIALLQEILNVLNVCSPSGNVLQRIMELIFLILEQMQNGHLLTLPTITAGCRSLASLSCMATVAEHVTEYYFKTLVKPQSADLELPQNVAAYGWQGVTASLVMPEASLDEFCQIAVSDCAALVLHAHIMQLLPRCSSLEQELGIAAQLVQWCTQLKPKPSQEAKVFLLWEKAIFLLLRQVRYSGNFAGVVPYLTSLASSMVRFGEDKATEGILGVIGLGKKSAYSHQFRLISRTMAAFLHCQMPVDSSQTTKLRVTPSAPGHIKDPAHHQQAGNTVRAIIPTKLGEQTHSNVESLVTNKHYSHLKEHVLFGLGFVDNPVNCVMNTSYLLVHMSTSLYPDSRYLDILRVLQ